MVAQKAAKKGSKIARFRAFRQKAIKKACVLPYPF